MKATLQRIFSICIMFFLLFCIIYYLGIFYLVFIKLEQTYNFDFDVL